MSEKYLNYITSPVIENNFGSLKKKIKLENYLYYLSLKEKVRLDAPTIVGLDITSKCNLRCKHCFIGDRSCSNELTTKEIEDLLIKLKKMGVYQIYIMGGEPFCRSDMMEIISFIKSLNMTISVNTNGTLIDESICLELSKILDKDTDWIQISLDGAKPETHNFIRDNDVFDKVIKNIQLLSRNNIPVRVNTVITNTNISELDDIYKLCNELGVKRINFNPLYPFKRETLISSPSNSDYIKAFEKVLGVHETLGKPIFIQQDPICVPYTIKEFKDFFEDNHNLAPNTNCRAGLYSFELDPEGNVYPCTFMHNKKFCAGNIRDEEIEVIWRDDSRWVSLLTRNHEKYLCKNCSFLSKCKGGCMAAANDCFGDTNAPDPRCELVGGMQE